MKSQFHVVKRPILTERTVSMKDAGQVVFEVHQHANKIEVKEAVEALFKVKVENVNTVNVKGKPKRLGVHAGNRRSYKKAIVTLAEGQKLDFLEG